MEKLIVRTTLLTVFMFPLTAFSATYNACADSGTCNSYNTYSGNASGGNLGAYQPGYVPGGGMGGGPSPEDLAKKEKAEYEGKKKYCKDNGYPTNVPFCAAFKEEEKQKQCANEKGRIDSENASRLSGIAGDNQREIARCRSEDNRGWSGSVSGGHQLLFVGVTYTVENPSYDKCVDAVDALNESSKAHAFEVYTRDQNTPRSAMNAQCADFYK